MRPHAGRCGTRVAPLPQAGEDLGHHQGDPLRAALQAGADSHVRDLGVEEASPQTLLTWISYDPYFTARDGAGHEVHAAFEQAYTTALRMETIDFGLSAVADWRNHIRV